MTLQLILETIDDTIPVVKTNYASDRNAIITYTPLEDMTVRIIWRITARTSAGGSVYYVPTVYSGATQVVGAENEGACNLYIPGTWDGGHFLFTPDEGFFELTAGVAATFEFGVPSSSCIVDSSDKSSIVMQQIA